MADSKNILTKSTTFYDTFERKPGSDQKTTTYCPGCGHGILHKIVGEALEDFGVQDRAIFLSPVGCSVFGYYYFHTGNVQTAHGRAPAVATGLKRANPESVVISYQGDGDLAAIGGLEIMHAANRGEGMTVIFVNNSIYGMTGGQMAPTTLEDQVTTTTPQGRSVENEGYPIKMSEIIATLDAPVYVERTRIADMNSIMDTRDAIRKALKIQIEGNGFAFVEVLTACNSNLGLDGPEGMEWVKETQSKVFPIGVKKDESDEFEGRNVTKEKAAPEELREILDVRDIKVPEDKVREYEDEDINQKLKIAGFGGQGILSLGRVFAEMGMRHKFKVSWLPSYGPEMRGGTANCSVKISSTKIGTPLVEKPTFLIAMNKPSLDKFESTVVKGGNIIYNSSIVKRKVEREDVNSVGIPATELAEELGSGQVANMIMFGAANEILDLFNDDVFRDSIGNILKPKYADINIEAMKKGKAYIQNNN